MGKLFLLSGYAGVGKNTVIKGILEKLDDIWYVPSVTTRSMRKGEVEGDPYYFETEEEFFKRVQEGDFFEFEEVHGNYYGTLRDEYIKKLNEGKNIIKDIDVNGALNIKKELGNNAVLIFVKPLKDGDIIERMRLRGDKEEDILKRKKRVEYEKGFIGKFNYVLLNDDIDIAINDGIEIIKKVLNEG